MYEIGEIVSEMSLDVTTTAGCTVYKGHEVYCVTTQDVELVTMAVNYAAWGVFTTVNDAYELFQGRWTTTIHPIRSRSETSINELGDSSYASWPWPKSDELGLSLRSKVSITRGL